MSVLVGLFFGCSINRIGAGWLCARVWRNCVVLKTENGSRGGGEGVRSGGRVTAAIERAAREGGGEGATDGFTHVEKGATDDTKRGGETQGSALVERFFKAPTNTEAHEGG